LTSLDGFTKVKGSFQEDSDIGIEIKKLGVKIKRIKLNNMVSAIWSRNYETLQQGIRRIVAYDLIRKKNGFMAPCLLLLGLVLVPYILLVYNSICYWIDPGEIDYVSLLWNVMLCLMPILGYLMVNHLKHKSQSVYSLMVFPASCFLLFSLISSMVSLNFRLSRTKILWKGEKYLIPN
jgi:hypothetical protein